MQRAIPQYAAAIVGVLLVLAGVLIPGSTIVAALRLPSPDLEELVLRGADYFRAGLVVLGVYVVFLAWYAERYMTASPGRLTNRASLRDFTILFVILLVATAIRFHEVDSGLWFDEMTTHRKYVRLPPGGVVTTFDSQNQHFLYTLLAKAAVFAFGDGTWSLRLPAAVFGIASIGVLFVLCKRLRNTREALLVAALMTVSYHHLWFSQNARGYTTLLFWTLLASWLFVEALDRNTPRIWTAYAAASALGAFTHLTMLFVVTGHFVIYLWTMAKRRSQPIGDPMRGLLFGFALAGLLIVQLYALVIPQMFAGTLREGTSGRIATWSSPLWAAREFVNAMELAYGSIVVFVVLMGITTVGFVRLRRESPIVLALTIVPAAIGAIVVLGTGHHVWPRFFFFAIGFVLMVLTAGATTLGEWVGGRLYPGGGGRTAGTIVCITLIAVSAATLPTAYGPKQDYVAALRLIEGQRRPGDAVVAVASAARAYRGYFGTNWVAVHSTVQLNRIRSAARRTWLVHTFPIELAAKYPDIHALLGKEFGVVATFHGTLHGGEVVVYRSDAPPGTPADVEWTAPRSQNNDGRTQLARRP